MVTKEWLSLFISLLGQAEELVWVVVLETQGSAPRRAGASMLVRPDGSTVGTVGGGPLEAFAREQALEVLQDKRGRVVRFALSASSGERAPEALSLPAHLDMTCGGTGSLLLAYVSQDNPTWMRALNDAQETLKSEQKSWLALMLPVADAAAEAADELVTLVSAEQTTSNCPRITPQLLQAIRERAQTGPALLEAEGFKLVAFPLADKEKLYIFGAGHCAQPLALVAAMLGFSVTVVDDRPEFVNKERFPAAEQLVICPSFSQAFADLKVDENTYVVIMTRGHQHDKAVLALALKTCARYIGMMGSTRKVAEIFRQLKEEGFPVEVLGQVHAPIGLEIGAETPEEIAISIAAELIKCRHERI